MKWLRAGSLLLIFLCAVLGRAQVSPINGFCINGAKPAITSGLPSSNFNQNLIPKCTVTVVLTGTTQPATLYSDRNQTPLTNPFTANADASWQLYVSTPSGVSQGYDITLSGGVAPNTYNPPRTLVDVLPLGVGGGGGGGGTPPAGPVDSYQFNNSGIFGGTANATYNPTTQISSFFGADLTPSSKLLGRDDVIDVYSDLGCDPTGVTECTAALTAGITAHPNATFLFPVPQSARTATYLLAGTANLTLPSTITLQFQNGAQIATGHGTPGTISSIARIGYDTQSRTMSLAGCTSSVPSAGTESFTNCPQTFNFNQIATMNGTTHVPPCYKGCLLQTETWNSFNLLNPAATTIIAAGTETGTLTQITSGYFLDATNPNMIVSSTTTTITVQVPNDFPARPGVVVMAGAFPSAYVGDPYPIIPSSVTSSGFQLACPPSFGCQATPPTNYPGGQAYFNPTGYASVIFTGNLGNMPASPGVSYLARIGLLYCSGTTNFNGMYNIMALSSPANAELEDLRATVPTETSGTCYVPYTLTVDGSVVAATNQQIVAPGSAVTFQGQSDTYVGWYGAGQGNAANDTIGTQTALLLNPSHRVIMPKIQQGFVGEANIPADYTFTDGVWLYGNAQVLDGNVGTIWVGGAATTVQCANKAEPCVLVPPNSLGSTVRNLALYGSCSAGPYPLIQPPYDSLAQDGIMSASAEGKIDYVQAWCFSRDGILIQSHSGFNAWVVGNGEPDFWEADSLFISGNGGYGIAVYGSDTNGGKVAGNNWASGNVYGGYHSESQIAGTFIHANGDSNSGNYGAGALINISSLSVSGTGASAVCSATLASALSGNSGIWIITAGTGVADGTYKTTTVNSTTVTWSCPGASGSASTGTMQTADSGSIYAALITYKSGENNYSIDGLIGGPNDLIAINPYSEGTNGCGEGQSGVVIGGTINEFQYQGSNCSPQYGQPNGMVGIGGGNGTLNVYASLLFLRAIESYSNAQLGLNAPWAGQGPNFNGFMGVSFSAFGDQNLGDWEMGVYPGDVFLLRDFAWNGTGGDNRVVFQVSPVFGGNSTLLTTPTANTGSLILGTGGAAGVTIQGAGAGISTGTVNFFQTSSNQIQTQITPNGLNFVPIPVQQLPSATANPGSMAEVNNSTAITTEGQPCTAGAGGPPVALAVSNGTEWKCF